METTNITEIARHIASTHFYLGVYDDAVETLAQVGNFVGQPLAELVGVYQRAYEECYAALFSREI